MLHHPIARELVLVGGGHSHVILLRMLGMNPIPGLAVTLVSPETSTPYSGMLPGVIAGHYRREEAFIDLGPLCRFAGANFIRAAVTGVDPDGQQVAVPGRPALRYDLLSVDVGSTPTLQNVSDQAVIPVKPISHFLERWDAFVGRLEYGGVREVGFVGSGAGGVELCLAVHHFLQQQPGIPPVQVHLFSADTRILAEFDDAVRQRFERVIAAAGIQVHLQFRARDFVNGQLSAGDDRTIELDEVFWVTQASAAGWLAESGLATNERGFLTVRDTLQSTSHDNVFAVGDCAVMENYPRPRAGVFAVRQGKPLYANIRASLFERPLKPYRPQSRYLALISMGQRYAVATRNGLSAEGGWVWRWKDWIDRRFMNRFLDLPTMKADKSNPLLASFDDQMHCGGCGAKVSADLLEDVLGAVLPQGSSRDDAAIVEIPAKRQMLQSVDHFRGFINDPYAQARIAVCHALSDIYACGGQAHSVMALITLPFGKPDVIRSTLEQVMAGIMDQLHRDHVKLIGGHTSEGAELSLGFTVNGSVIPGKLWQKTGMQAGDVLILTKPLGTGAIFAADMQHRARGDWVAAAVASMEVSNKAASQVLSHYEVSACTDITGFGLAGHCLEMLTGKLGVELYLSAMPCLPGAMACISELGITSTLHESNRRVAGLALPGEAAEILFDPQTSGGLLAAVPAHSATSCLQDLVEAGYGDAAVVGRVNDAGRLVLNLSGAWND